MEQTDGFPALCAAMDMAGVSKAVIFGMGIGEIMSRHDDLTALTYGEAPHVDGPGFRGIYDLAAAKGLPVLVHYNVTAQNTEKVLYLDELKCALAYNRNCNIIWAHVGIFLGEWKSRG